jgi:hypothetical protein
MADTLLDTLAATQASINGALAELAGNAVHPAVAEVTNVTIVGAGASFDTATGKYWTLHDGANAAHYVWYLVSDGLNGPASDPAPGGTGHQVTILLADTATQIAVKTAAVVDALAGFISPVPTTATLKVTNAVAGPATDATAGTSGATIAVLTQGAAANSTISTDFVSTKTIATADLLNPDSESLPGQDKSLKRKVLRSVLTHRVLADILLDSIVALQTNANALMVKLDAQAGTLSATDFASTLSVDTIDDMASYHPAQDEAGVRTIMRSVMANKSLADQLLDCIIGMQEGLNGVLADLDAKNTLATAARETPTLDPESTT